MSDRTNFDIIKRYKKMKSINQICKENNIRASNVDIEGKEVEYSIEKSKFNSLYGMSEKLNIQLKNLNLIVYME